MVTFILIIMEMNEEMDNTINHLSCYGRVMNNLFVVGT